MTGPTPKGEASRQEILSAAARVFAQRGYKATRMEDVIQAADMTKGAIYFHFRSKKALARAVVDDHKRRWLALGAAEVERFEEPGEQLRALGELLIDLAATSDSSWGLVRLAEQIRSEDAVEAADPSPMREWVALVAEIVDRGQRAGRFNDEMSGWDAAVILVASFDGLKTASDALAPGETEAFRRQAAALLSLLLSNLSV